MTLVWLVIRELGGGYENVRCAFSSEKKADEYIAKESCCKYSGFRKKAMILQ